MRHLILVVFVVGAVVASSGIAQASLTSVDPAIGGTGLPTNWVYEGQAGTQNAYPVHYEGVPYLQGSGGLFAYDFRSDGTNYDGFGLANAGFSETYEEYGYVDASLWYKSATDNWGFYSFCLEHNEYVSTQPTDYAGQLNETAELVGSTSRSVYGGVGPAGDAISQGTAWLYFQFATGALTGFTYPTTSSLDDVDPNLAAVKADAGILQETFWYLEDEAGAPSSNKFLNLIPAAITDPKADYDPTSTPDWLKVVQSDGTVDFARIYAANLYDVDSAGNPTVRKQDFLFMDGVKKGVIPEPMTFLIWGVGLCLAAIVRRR